MTMRFDILPTLLPAPGATKYRVGHSGIRCNPIVLILVHSFNVVQTWAEVGRLASAYIVLARAIRVSPFRCVSFRLRTRAARQDVYRTGTRASPDRSNHAYLFSTYVCSTSLTKGQRVTRRRMRRNSGAGSRVAASGKTITPSRFG
jgi:hypothetical protein